jgi:hypothetical protein
VATSPATPFFSVPKCGFISLDEAVNFLWLQLNGKIVLRVLGAFAWVLFIVSIFLPFLQAQWVGMHISEVYPGPENFWSFKRTYEYRSLYGEFGGGVEDWWFVEYWSQEGMVTYPAPFGSWVGSVLMFMFVFQVFAVFFAALAIFKVEPYLFLSSAILNVLTILCMWFVGSALDSDYAITFQAGFWLTSPSAPMFFVAFTESCRQYRKKRANVADSEEQACELVEASRGFQHGGAGG